MDKDWAEMNKEMQALLSKEATFREAIRKLIELRESLFAQITQIVNTFPEEAFSQMPFAGAEGYHSKTLAYSIWHIFRIEDIVAHEMIAEDQQVLFSQDYLVTIHSPIITTGNELSGDGIVEFSIKLNIHALYRYAQEVKQSTDHILTEMEYPGLKRTFGEDMIEKLRRTGCVSDAESAVWLIKYWCGKDVLGLIRMPFSRHWIMHIEAMQRIKNRLCRLARKGVDPIAYCGFSCDHCFLSQWCGSCRTAYNTCSFATVSPDGNAPTRFAARKKASTDAMNVACWKPAIRVFILPPMMAQTRPGRRPCTSESTAKRPSSRYMIGSMENMILPKPRKFWVLIFGKVYGSWKRIEAK